MSNIELKKQINQLNREAAQKAKRDTCLICGKSCTSFCNSHIIPQFILKSIADDGIVLQGTSAFNNQIEGHQFALNKLLYIHPPGISHSFLAKMSPKFLTLNTVCLQLQKF